jgi:hypothetical protein
LASRIPNNRERQSVIEHGVEYIDKRHSGNQTGKEIGPHIADRADQYPASRAAFGDNLSWGAPTTSAQIFTYRDEIGKRGAML